jgi:hypothetical protein
MYSISTRLRNTETKLFQRAAEVPDDQDVAASGVNIEDKKGVPSPTRKSIKQNNIVSRKSLL